MPAALRKKLRLRPGQTLMWKMVSDTECRVLVIRQSPDRSSYSARGYMKQFQKGMPVSTSEWMKLLREGEDA